MVSILLYRSARRKTSMVLLWTSKLVAIWHRVPQKENDYASVDLWMLFDASKCECGPGKESMREVDVGLGD